MESRNKVDTRNIIAFPWQGCMLSKDLTSFFGPPSRFRSFERLNSLNEQDSCCLETANQFMNILLQNKRTKHYIERDGGWTARAAQARVFGSGLEAILYCLKHHHCADMQISGEFVDVRMNFTMPVTDLRV